MDGDALDHIYKTAEFFVKNGIKIWKVALPENEDPSSLGHDETWKYIDSAEIITESQIFDFKFKQKLKGKNYAKVQMHEKLETVHKRRCC